MSKYMRFWYKIRIEKYCSSSGILERYLSTGNRFFWAFSEMLVSLRCWKEQSRLGFEIFKCGRQGYFFIESRRTASQDIWLEGEKHSPKNLTFNKLMKIKFKNRLKKSWDPKQRFLKNHETQEQWTLSFVMISDDKFREEVNIRKIPPPYN